MDRAVPLGANMVAQIHTTSKTITIYEGDSVDDSVYYPARSIYIGELGLRVLLDALIDMFPLEKEKGQSQKTAQSSPYYHYTTGNVQCNNVARDLEADLAICEAATPGPYTIEPCGCGHSACKYVFIRKITHSDGRLLPEDARFIAEAREGWSYAIRRALEAEAEVDRLRNELQIYQEQVNQGCGPE